MPSPSSGNVIEMGRVEMSECDDVAARTRVCDVLSLICGNDIVVIIIIIIIIIINAFFFFFSTVSSVLMNHAVQVVSSWCCTSALPCLPLV